MQTKNILFTTVFVLLISSCRQDILEPKASSNVSRPIKKDATPRGGNANARLSIGQSYCVIPTWAPAAWTRKGKFNGDQNWDIISVDLASSQAIVKISNGGATNCYTTQYWSIDNQWSNDAGYMFAGDFNGDGYTDLASANGNNVYMKFNGWSGFTYATWTVNPGWGQANRTVVGDFDGNGIADIASISGTNTYMRLSNGISFFDVNWPTNGNYGGGGWTFAADYNSDGLDDLVSVNGTQLLIKQSTGANFINIVHTTTNTWGSVDFTWSGDTNNNGRDEIITAINTTIYVREWTGSSTWSLTSVPTINLWGANGFNFVENYNGSDGDDLVSCISNAIYVH